MMFPKSKPLRSKKLRDFARGQSCVRCGADDGTIVGAHLAEQGWCGRGIKCGDDRIAHLCRRCHELLDSAGRRWWKARDMLVQKTMQRVIADDDMRGHYLEITKKRFEGML